jgi:hypothetical protein
MAAPHHEDPEDPATWPRASWWIIHTEHFSGENKTYTVLRAAYRAGLAAAPPGPKGPGMNPEPAPQPEPSAARWRESEEFEAEIRAAYCAGAKDVHENWQEDSDPDFSEAAGDYFASLPAAPLPPRAPPGARR